MRCLRGSPASLPLLIMQSPGSHLSLSSCIAAFCGRCDARTCQRDPILARVRDRIANLTMVPERNAEHMQVLKYEQGQFYRTHHDQNSPMTSAWGPRMYTFFMYLNEENDGGETHFPQLNISVRPRRGRALLWPSVLDRDPNERDDRTEHEAVTVTKGTKFAANYWLHMVRKQAFQFVPFPSCLPLLGACLALPQTLRDARSSPIHIFFSAVRLSVRC